MIWNIIDRRERPYRWKIVNAVIEAVEHDNSVQDADQADEFDPSTIVDYDERNGISIHAAVEWASKQPSPVTLYLYDEGRGTGVEEHFDAQGHRFPGEPVS
jgi:hypothetical protein